MTGPEVFGIIGGLAGIAAVITAIIQVVRGGSITPESTWQSAIKDLRAQVTELKTELAETRKSQALYKAEVDDLRGVVLILTAQLRENGIEPRIQPQPKRAGTGPLSGQEPKR